MATNELQEGLDAILEEKQNYIIPQNIKSGVEILGVEGAIVDGGVDTTDANAIAEDLSFGKTAYVNGEKITGTLRSDGVYNIIQQVHEPETKAGIWIRGDNTNIEQVYFSGNSTASGEFLPSSNYQYLQQSDTVYSEVIINGFMYRVCNNLNIKKYNLITKELVATYTGPFSVSHAWAFEYKGNILICYHGSGLNYLIFYTSTNKYSDATYMNVYPNTTDLYQYIVQLVGDKIYTYVRAYYERNDITNIFDLTTNTSSTGPAINGLIMSYQNRYIDYTTIGSDIYVMDVQNTSYRLVKSTLGTANSSKTIQNVPSMGVIYSFGNFIYLFPKGNNINTYYRYDTINDIWETQHSDVKFSIDCAFSYYSYAKRYASFDSLSGILYICKPSSYVNAFQLDASADVSDLYPNTLVVNTSLYGSNALMKNLNNLVVSVGNTGIVKGSIGNNYLDASHMLCVGDGVSWHFVKNPDNLTSTISFDCVGGSEIQDQQVICGSVIPKPTNPTKYHYLFNEWLWKGETYNFKHLVIDDMTLEATWNDAFIVTYDYDDGTSVDDTVLPNTKTTKPVVDPVKEWKEFLGWSLNGVPFDFNTPITEDITLTPIWGTVEEVDYIYSTGGQYIDTGIIPTGDTTVEMDIRLSSSASTTEWVPIFGSRDLSSSKQTFFAMFYAQNMRRLYYGYGNSETNMTEDSQYDLSDRNTIKCTPTGMYLNDELVIERTKSTFTGRRSMLLFALNTWTNSSTMSVDDRKPGTTMYNCKVYNGETLIANFIPAKAYDGKFVLYDKIGKKIYRNKGTKNFFGPGKTWEQVEYLQSTGTQYISTGVIVNNTVDYEIDFNFLKTTSYDSRWVPLIGYQSTNNSSSNKLAFWINSYSRLASINYYSSDSVGSGSPVLSGRHLLRNMDNKFYIDGSLVYTANSGTFTGVNDVCFFACNQNGSRNTNTGWTRIYNVKLYGYNNVVIRNYIPVVDENGRPCFYDKISKEYLYNAGTGEFLLPVKEGDYTEIPFVQTNGAQYFNLGVTISNAIKLEMKYNAMDYFKDNFGVLFGGRDSYSSNAFMLFSSNSNPYEFPWFYRGVNVYQTVNNYYWNKDVTVTASNGIVTLNDGEHAETISLTGQSTFTGNTKLTIFSGEEATNDGVRTERCITGKIYYIKVYLNNNLAIDLIPVKDKNGIVCLYDKITETFLYHIGRGTLLDYTAEFEDVQYIDSYGSQYIDTLYKPNNNTRVEMKAKLVRDGRFDGCLFGCANTSTTVNRMGLWFTGRNREICTSPYMGSQSQRYLNIASDDTDYVFAVDNSGFSIDGNKVVNWDSGTFTCSENLWLFGTNGSSGDNWKRFVGRTYYCKIWENDELVRYFIPRKDLSGAVVMYDSVTDRYYAPFGGGECTGGLPNGYTQVPYIRNITGRCCIDTGFKPNNFTRTLISFEVVNFVGWSLYWGTCGGYTGTEKNKGYYMDNGNAMSTLAHGRLGSSYRNTSTRVVGDGHIVDCNRASGKIDGVSTSCSDYTRQSDYNMLIFGATDYEGNYPRGGLSDMKLFTFAIYDKGWLIRNYVPCYRNADGRTGVFDTVNNQFYGNYNYDYNGDEFYYGNTDYNELAYLTGSGLQYIDTGVKPVQNMRLDMEVMNTQGYAYWFGAWSDSSGSKKYCVYNNGGNVYIGYGSSSGTYGSALSNARHIIVMDGASLLVDASNFRTMTADTFNISNNLYLYAYNRPGQGNVFPLNQGSESSIISATMKIGGILQRAFVPSIRKTDKKVGLLDVKNNIFYTNEGMGEFKYKEIGVPLQEYREIEYIQSTGSQYINTGIVGKSTLGFDAKFMVKNTISNENTYNSVFGYGCVFGGRDSSGVNDFQLSTFMSPNQETPGGTLRWGTSVEPQSINPKITPNEIMEVSLRNGVYTDNDGNTYNVSGDYQSNYNIYLFGLNNANSFSQASYTRLYNIKFYDGDVLIRDFQPAQILATQEYVLVDKVENKIYRNLGSVWFIGEGYEPMRVSYVQSNGSQYTSSLIPGNEIGKIEMKFMITSRSSGNWNGILFSENNTDPWGHSGIRVQSDNKLGFDYGASDPSVTAITNVDYEIVYDVIDRTVKINGTEGYLNPAENVHVKTPLYFFANNQADSAKHMTSVRLYYARVYNRNYELIGNFVPVADQNKWMCLYDRVNCKYVYHQGGSSLGNGSLITDLVDEIDARQVGDVLNEVLGSQEDIVPGGYDIDVQDVLDNILGGAN